MLQFPNLNFNERFRAYENRKHLFLFASVFVGLSTGLAAIKVKKKSATTEIFKITKNIKDLELDSDAGEILIVADSKNPQIEVKKIEWSDENCRLVFSQKSGKLNLKSKKKNRLNPL